MLRQRITQLQTVYASKWRRATALLHWICTQAKRLVAEGPRSRIKAFIKKALLKINHELLLRPALRQSVLHWSRKLGVHAKLRSLLAKAQRQPQMFGVLEQDFNNLPTDFQNLSPRGRQIYGDLKQAIEHYKKEGH